MFRANWSDKCPQTNGWSTTESKISYLIQIYQEKVLNGWKNLWDGRLQWAMFSSIRWRTKTIVVHKQRTVCRMKTHIYYFDTQFSIQVSNSAKERKKRKNKKCEECVYCVLDNVLCCLAVSVVQMKTFSIQFLTCVKPRKIWRFMYLWFGILDFFFIC